MTSPAPHPSKQKQNKKDHHGSFPDLCVKLKEVCKLQSLLKALLVQDSLQAGLWVGLRQAAEPHGGHFASLSE